MMDLTEKIVLAVLVVIAVVVVVLLAWVMLETTADDVSVSTITTLNNTQTILRML